MANDIGKWGNERVFIVGMCLGHRREIKNSDCEKNGETVHEHWDEKVEVVLSSFTKIVP